MALDPLWPALYDRLQEDVERYDMIRTASDADTQVLNLTEAAKFVRVSEKTMREMARGKRVPCQKVGREWRFLRSGLEHWLAGETPCAMVAESAQAYGQTELFPAADTVDEKETKAGFGDSAFTNNRREPVHRWVPWVAGFSAAFVEGVLDAAVPGKADEVTVLDPFAGVGTTLVEGLKRGHDVIGFEINPYAALACDVKVSSVRCTLKQLAQAIQEVDDLRRQRPHSNARPKSVPPRDFKSRRPFFSPAVERQVLLLQDLMAQQTNGFLRDVMKLALGAVMVSFSNYSYEPSLSTRAAAGKDEIEDADVLTIFREKLWEIEVDIGFLQRHMKRFKHKPKAKVHRRSYLDGSRVLPARSVDVVVTSPPYLNNYHYVRNTRPQLYWLGLVDQRPDLKKLEEDSFGRFWQTVRAGPRVELAFELPGLRKLLETIRERNPEKGAYGGSGWANYAATYFNDCDRFFEITRRVMKRGGWVVVVIGNNIVQGVHIETDQFLARIAEMHGFKLDHMHRVRKKRTGSSIVNSSVRVGVTHQRTELYETAVQLRAPQ